MLIALACAWYSRATGHSELLVSLEICQILLLLPLESQWRSAVAVAHPHIPGPQLSCRLAPKLAQTCGPKYLVAQGMVHSHWGVAALG